MTTSATLKALDQAGIRWRDPVVGVESISDLAEQFTGTVVQLLNGGQFEPDSAGVDPLETYMLDHPRRAEDFSGHGVGIATWQEMVREIDPVNGSGRDPWIGTLSPRRFTRLLELLVSVDQPLLIYYWSGDNSAPYPAGEVTRVVAGELHHLCTRHDSFLREVRTRGPDALHNRHVAIWSTPSFWWPPNSVWLVASHTDAGSTYIASRDEAVYEKILSGFPGTSWRVDAGTRLDDWAGYSGLA